MCIVEFPKFSSSTFIWTIFEDRSGQGTAHKRFKFILTFSAIFKAFSPLKTGICQRKQLSTCTEASPKTWCWFHFNKLYNQKQREQTQWERLAPLDFQLSTDGQWALRQHARLVVTLYFASWPPPKRGSKFKNPSYLCQFWVVINPKHSFPNFPSNLLNIIPFFSTHVTGLSVSFPGEFRN